MMLPKPILDKVQKLRESNGGSFVDFMVTFPSQKGPIVWEEYTTDNGTCRENKFSRVARQVFPILGMLLLHTELLLRAERNEARNPCKFDYTKFHRIVEEEVIPLLWAALTPGGPPRVTPTKDLVPSWDSAQAPSSQPRSHTS